MKIFVVPAVMLLFFSSFGLVIKALRRDVRSQFKKGLRLARLKGAAAGLLIIAFCTLAIILTSHTGDDIVDIAIVYAIYFFTLIGNILGIYIFITCIFHSDKKAINMLKELTKNAESYIWIK